MLIPHDTERSHDWRVAPAYVLRGVRMALGLMALVVATSTLGLGCNRGRTPPSAPARPGLPDDAIGWRKGQTHLHSNLSGDSGTPPADVIRFYTEHGYDFIVFTDHNRVTRAPASSSLLVIPGVELTQNLSECNPPDPEVKGCNLHMNALFVSPQAPAAVELPPSLGATRLEVYLRELQLARSYGGLAQLNHPNFRWGADAATVTELARKGVRFLEIANASGDCNDEGDARHPGTEVLWDQALTAGLQLFGVATDDAHHYYDADAARRRGETAYTGDRGFIMVRAARSEAALRAALLSGDFYASTGVLLSRVALSASAMELAVAPETTGDCEFTFIGTGGRELARSRGRTARYPIAGLTSGYVRAVVRDSAGHRAWVQPVRFSFAP